jgi:hypothetical protein
MTTITMATTVEASYGINSTTILNIPIICIKVPSSTDRISFNTSESGFEAAFLAETIEALKDLDNLESLPVYNTVEEFLRATRKHA